MQTESTLDRQDMAASPASTAPAKRGGWLYDCGPQAWIDMVMSHNMIVKRGWRSFADGRLGGEDGSSGRVQILGSA